MRAGNFFEHFLRVSSTESEFTDHAVGRHSTTSNIFRSESAPDQKGSVHANEASETPDPKENGTMPRTLAIDISQFPRDSKSCPNELGIEIHSKCADPKKSVKHTHNFQMGLQIHEDSTTRTERKKSEVFDRLPSAELWHALLD